MFYANKLSLLCGLFLGFSTSMLSQQHVDLFTSFLAESDGEKQYDLLNQIMYANDGKSFEVMESQADSLLYLSKHDQNMRLASLAHMHRGDAYYFEGKGDSAVFYYQLQAVVLEDGSYENIDHLLISSGYGNQASILYSKGEKKKAIDIAYQALGHAQKLKGPKGLADIYYILAGSYFSLLQSDSALVYFDKCYQIDLRNGNTRGIVDDLFLLGSLYESQDKSQLALSYYQAALDTIKASPLDLKTEKMKATSNLGIAYLSTSEVDSAIYFLELSKAICDSLQHKYYQDRIDLRLSEAYMNAGQLDKAEPLITDLRNRINDISDMSVRIGTYISSVKIELQKDQINEAEGYLNRGIALVEQTELKNQKLNLYPLAVQLFEKKGDYQQAITYSKLNSETIKKYNNDEIEKAVLTTKFNYESEKLQNEKAVIKEENSTLSRALSNRTFAASVLAILLILLSGAALISYQLYRSREKLRQEIQTAILAKKEIQILEKEMEALRAQMNPHFIFNSLSSINHYIINKEPRDASKYLTKFARLMRSILANSKERYITLTEELEALKLYTEIENIRFDQKFKYIEDIEEGLNMAECYLPPLLLQPFIENAIKHGFDQSRTTNYIKVQIRKRENSLYIQIEDNGKGRAASQREKRKVDNQQKSYGINITESRLDAISKMYKGKYAVVVEDIYQGESPAGTKIMISFPLMSKIDSAS